MALAFNAKNPSWKLEKSAVKLPEGLLVVVDPRDAVVPWVGFCFLEGFLFASSLGGRLHGERKVEVKYHALQIG